MTDVSIRKVVTLVDEVRIEARQEVSPPVRKVAVAAVIENPYAGRYEADLRVLIEAGEQLGALLAQHARDALGEDAPQSFGKAGIAGTNGELEHVAAVLHPKLGAPLRDALGAGKAIVPSTKKVGGPGTPIDVPLHFKDAAFVRSHFDAIEARVADAPRADELVIVVAVTNGGRPLPRIGGLTLQEVEGVDGLR